MGELLLLLLEVDEVEELLLLDEDEVDELLLLLLLLEEDEAELLLLLEVVVIGSTTYSSLMDMMPMPEKKPQAKYEGRPGLCMRISEPSIVEKVQKYGPGLTNLSCWHVSVMLPAEVGVQRNGLMPAPEA